MPGACYPALRRLPGRDFHPLEITTGGERSRARIVTTRHVAIIPAAADDRIAEVTSRRRRERTKPVAPTPRSGRPVDVVASCRAGDRHVRRLLARFVGSVLSSTIAEPSSTTGPLNTSGAATCSRRHTRHPWRAVPSSTSRSPSITPSMAVNVEGYRLTNIGIHVLCALALFGLAWADVPYR